MSVVRSMLEAGAEENAPNRDGISPLHIASSNGRLEVVRLLVEAQGDKNSPWAVQCHICLLFLVSVILIFCHSAQTLYTYFQGSMSNLGPEHRGVSPLFTAAQNSHATVVRLLLEARAEDGQARQDWRIPLHAACESGCLEAVRLLLDAQSDKDRVEQHGVTPLFTATQKGHRRVVRLLLKERADQNKARHDGATPLFVAALSDQLRIVELLLEARTLVSDQPRTFLLVFWTLTVGPSRLGFPMRGAYGKELPH